MPATSSAAATAPAIMATRNVSRDATSPAAARKARKPNGTRCSRNRKVPDAASASFTVPPTAAGAAMGTGTACIWAACGLRA